MLEKIGELAEQLATRASRRQLLGRFGRAAMSLAAAGGALLAMPPVAQGSRRPPAACDAGSDNYCRGLVEGAYCQIGTTPGRCVGSPACRCQPVSPRRPRR